MREDIKLKKAFALVVGMVYVLSGGLQFLYSLGLGIGYLEVLLNDSNVLRSVVMVIVGIVFLYGHRILTKNEIEGFSYVYTGIFLSLLYSSLYILILAANASNALISGEALAISNDIIPMIYLGVLPFIGLLIWRKSFSVGKLSKAGV